MSSPLVSVIIPVYNIADYITDCLQSVIKQTYSNLEILVIDDGSTDQSGSICNDLADQDSRIQVFHRSNAGLSVARNFGIQKSRGEYIAFVDGDDSVTPHFIKALLNAATKNSSDIVVCGYQSNGKQITPHVQSIPGPTATTKLLIGQENYDIVAWNKLYRRSLFNNIKYPPGQTHEDSLTTYKLYSKAQIVTYIKDSLYYYRTRSDSIMHQADEANRLKAREQAAREAIRYLKTTPDLYNAAEVSLLLAKYAFLDAVIAHRIPPKQHYYHDNLNWIKIHRNSFRHNHHLTSKLRLYNQLVALNLYKLFRIIKH